MKRTFTLIERIQSIIIISLIIVIVLCVINTSNIMKKYAMKDNGISKNNNIKLLNDKNYVAKYINDEEISVDDLYAELQDLKQRLNGLTANEINGKINALTDKNNTNNIFLKTYPVGSIYVTNTSTNPGTIFGGTWVSFGTGRTLVGVDTSQTEFDTVEKTGGEKTHTLSVSELPSHKHTTLIWFYGSSSFGQQTLTFNEGNGYIFNFNSTVVKNMNAATVTGPLYSNFYESRNTGGDESHNNLQPYITVYMWKRTA